MTCSEYACRARGVATHTCPMAPYRGVSRPVITLAMERLMDKAAAAFAIDPLEIRRRNLIRMFPYMSATGLVFDEATYVETMDDGRHARSTCRHSAGIRPRRAPPAAISGSASATFSERTGYGTPAFAARGMEVTPGWETVELSMDPSGFVEARIGASPHGQGLRTTLAQIVADELGVTPDRIRITHGDTDRTPYGFGTFASRSLVIAGGASLMAARKIGAKLRVMAGHLLEAAAHDIVLEHGSRAGRRHRPRNPDRDAGARGLSPDPSLRGELTPGLTESATYDPPGTFSNACHIAIVEVDVETGKVTLERLLVAEDAGRLINPMIVDGQIHGGVAQGLANALLEEIVHDETGNILTATLRRLSVAHGARNAADRNPSSAKPSPRRR